MIWTKLPTIAPMSTVAPDATASARASLIAAAIVWVLLRTHVSTCASVSLRLRVPAAYAGCSVSSKSSSVSGVAPAAKSLIFLSAIISSLYLIHYTTVARIKPPYVPCISDANISIHNRRTWENCKCYSINIDVIKSTTCSKP